MPVRPAIIPCLTYQDALTAIDFLCTAFGFSRKMIVADETDPTLIHHAQLLLTDQMIMLSSASDLSRQQLGMYAITELAGKSPVCLYVTIDDPDAHHDQAAAAGAVIITPPHDNDYGGQGYEVRDCEGITWSFGNYDPWTDTTA